MNKIFTILVSTRTTLIALVLFALAMASATFIENDFGTQTARTVVYNTWWFEMLMLILAINFIGNIFRYGLLQKKKFPILLFHLAFIVILIGAGVSRYFGFEGIMRLREGESSNVIISERNYVQIRGLKRSESLDMKKEAYFSPIQKNHFSWSMPKGETQFEVEYVDFVADAVQVLTENEESGQEILEIVVGKAGALKSEYLFYQPTKSEMDQRIPISFSNRTEEGINIWSENGKLRIQSDKPVDFFNMISQQGRKLEAEMPHNLVMNAMYNIEGFTFVPVKFLEKGELKWVSQSEKPKDNSDLVADMLSLRLRFDSEERLINLPYKHGYLPEFIKVDIGGQRIEMGYGAIPVLTDFSLYLRDFELEKYPGSTSPSSYASEVTILHEGEKIDYRIYMNHVLDYQGHRFFQASYDSDEKGSVLAVNRDRAGTIITYIGYLLMGLGMFFTLFLRGSRFQQILTRLNQLKKETSLTLILGLLSLGLYSQSVPGEEINLVNREQAAAFGKLMVQDLDGRIKPVNTLSSEFLRKVSRKTSLQLQGQNLSADQVFLAMHMNPGLWAQIPLIKIDRKKLGKEIADLPEGSTKLLALNDFINKEDKYILEKLVKISNEKKPAERSEFNKEILTVDERFNIVFNILSGNYLRIFPKKNDPSNTWYGPNGIFSGFEPEDEKFVSEILPIYYEALRKGNETGDWTEAENNLAYIATYQNFLASDLIPSETQIKAELLYNRLNLNFWLFQVYFTLGLGLLVFALMKVFSTSPFWKTASWVLIILAIFSFILQAFNLILRWYIAEYPPWSNGYEMIVFVSWSLVIVGLVFQRKSDFTLPLALIFSAVMLFVSYLDWLNPEITNLMPVLKSYWLKIHVATIIGSYAPLALSALLGVLAQVLILIRNQRNHEKISAKLMEITYINELSMTIGLFTLSIGTFLGGIWANESWGRYWAWDPKETWALISIIVYAVVLHLRFVPRFNNLYTLNFASTIAFYSIIMTSFGVNYYLTGLHSYATGDPVPIPTFAYVGTALIGLLAILSYYHFLKENRNPV